MRKIILLLLIILAPVVVNAADETVERPHWSIEVKGGNFTPVLKNFVQYYGKRSMPEYAGSLAYKLVRQVEVGISGGYTRAKGQAFAPIHGTAAGSVTYELFPLNVFVLLRGVIKEEQWVVPYAGGGFTRLFYREQIEGQDTVKGSVDGYHVRGGLQFSLDAVDQSAANNMYRDYGIYHTYLFIETEYTHAVQRSVSTNLGGTAYLGGLLFEF